MVFKIRWTRSASEDLENIFRFLLDEWSQAVAASFAQSLSRKLSGLRRFPGIGRIENKEKGIRGVLITKCVKLFYRISNGHLVLLALFDVRQDSTKIQF